MRYLIEVFHKKTERLAYKIEIPTSMQAQLAQIMGWTAEQLGFEGYDLSPAQLSQLEAMIGRRIADPDMIFQLTCNG